MNNTYKAFLETQSVCKLHILRGQLSNGYHNTKGKDRSYYAARLTAVEKVLSRKHAELNARRIYKKLRADYAIADLRHLKALLNEKVR